jgi:predicted DNA-binding protein (MmcQ/YjbR family)
MDIEQFRAYCLAKPDTSEDFPFDEYTLCLRRNGKIFALTGLDNEVFTVNLKCDPEYSLELRERYSEVQPGFHMNKAHWNTVDFTGSLSDELLRQLVDMSYELVAKKPAKKPKKQ